MNSEQWAHVLRARVSLCAQSGSRSRFCWRRCRPGCRWRSWSASSPACRECSASTSCTSRRSRLTWCSRRCTWAATRPRTTRASPRASRASSTRTASTRPPYSPSSDTRCFYEYNLQFYTTHSVLVTPFPVGLLPYSSARPATPIDTSTSTSSAYAHETRAVPLPVLLVLFAHTCLGITIT